MQYRKLRTFIAIILASLLLCVSMLLFLDSMVHNPSVQTYLLDQLGKLSNYKIQAKEINRAKNRLDEILVYHTGQSIEVIEKDTDRDFFLSAEEAVEYGLIDKIIKAREGVVRAK